jgi:hypothetical protein
VSQLKIIMKGSNPSTDFSLTVDGVQVFCDDVQIHITPQGAKAVITILDLDLEYEGDVLVKRKARDRESGEWKTADQLDNMAKGIRGDLKTLSEVEEARIGLKTVFK